MIHAIMILRLQSKTNRGELLQKVLVIMLSSARRSLPTLADRFYGSYVRYEIGDRSLAKFLANRSYQAGHRDAG